MLALLAIMAMGGCSDPESRLAEIRGMQAGGRYEESIQPLRVLLTADPENGEANYRLGIALVQTGRSSLALWPLMKAANDPKLKVPAGLLLASTLASQESYEEAVRAANAVLKADPDNISALYTRSRSYIGAQQPAKALEDADQILKIRPDDGQGYSLKAAALLDLHRYEDAEKSQIKLVEITSTGKSVDKAARACGVLGRFYADQDQPEKAEKTFAECLEKYPNHPMLRNWATTFYTNSGNNEVALEIWRKAVENNPEDLDLRISLASVLQETGDDEEAEDVLESAAKLFDTAIAWQKLASIYRKNGKPTQSREALQKALKRARTEPDQLRYTLADLFIEEGDYESAEKVAVSLKEASYRHMLSGAIALAQDKPQEALEKFDAGFRLWPNNARARYLAGRAALKVGDYDRAIREFREAVRVDETETDASLELARIYLAFGQFSTAKQFATRHRKNRDFDGPDAHIIAARALVATGDPKGALELLTQLRSMPEYEAMATAEYATLLRNSAEKGSEAAISYMDKTGIDLTAPENEIALRIYLEDLLLVGRADDALKLSEEALTRSPDSSSAMELKARVLARIGRTQEARALTEQAIAIDAENAQALELMGTLAAQAGDLKSALEYFDRAAAAEPSDADYAYYAAGVTQAMGNTDESVARLRHITEQSPGHVGASNDLAWRLAEMESDLDLALQLATRAALSEPNSNTLDTLGWVQLKMGSTDEAIATFERALAIEPDSPSIRYRLGVAQAKTGDTVTARTNLETAINTTGNFPERDAARAELAKLQGS